MLTTMSYPLFCLNKALFLFQLFHTSLSIVIRPKSDHCPCPPLSLANPLTYSWSVDYTEVTLADEDCCSMLVDGLTWAL